MSIARALEDAGIRSMEIGFPAIGTREVSEMNAIAKIASKSMVMALCRTTIEDVDAARAAFERIPRIRCGVNLFLATSQLHREKRFQQSSNDLLARTEDVVRYSRNYFNLVSFSAEDASRTETTFLYEIYHAAIRAGATTIGFPDTVGILNPEQARDAILGLRREFSNTSVRIAAHFHNDLGLATANTLAAIDAGADIVQCTVNGMGERAGNAALEEVVMAMKVAGHSNKANIGVDTTKLFALSRLVAQMTSVAVSPQKPIVGDRVFSTTAGLHQEALLKDIDCYQPFSPSLVGGPGVKLLLGRLSGRAAAIAYLNQKGLDATDQAVEGLLQQFKESTSSDGYGEIPLDVD
jgi:2-isopropylmalate synthase